MPLHLLHDIFELDPFHFLPGRRVLKLVLQDLSVFETDLEGRRGGVGARELFHGHFDGGARGGRKEREDEARRFGVAGERVEGRGQGG